MIELTRRDDPAVPAMRRSQVSALPMALLVDAVLADLVEQGAVGEIEQLGSARTVSAA